MGITTDIRDRLIAIERTMVYGGKNVLAAAYIPEKAQPYQTPIFINIPRTATRVQRADCLLYTSPSPRDGLLSRMPSSA